MSNICQHYQNYIIELKAARAASDAARDAYAAYQAELKKTKEQPMTKFEELKAAYGAAADAAAAAYDAYEAAENAARAATNTARAAAYAARDAARDAYAAYKVELKKQEEKQND